MQSFEFDLANQSFFCEILVILLFNSQKISQYAWMIDIHP